jgi:hypothetical protein
VSKKLGRYPGRVAALPRCRARAELVRDTDLEGAVAADGVPDLVGWIFRVPD